MNNENEALRKTDDISLDDTINIKKMPGRFKRNTADILDKESGGENISSVSECVSNSEKSNSEKPECKSTDTANDAFIKKGESVDEIPVNEIEKLNEINEIEEVEEISIDIEDIKKEISADVEETLSKVLPDMLSKELPDIFRNTLKSEKSGTELSAELNGVRAELETIKKRMQTMQLSMEDGLRDNGNNTTTLHKSAAEIRDRITEISKTMNSVSKLSDSVFDLKNAQLNMRKILDNQGALIAQLKKKLNVSTVVLSVLAVLVIILQIIGLLS